jgi:hypothetical protein
MLEGVLPTLHYITTYTSWLGKGASSVKCSARWWRSASRKETCKWGTKNTGAQFLSCTWSCRVVGNTRPVMRTMDDGAQWQEVEVIGEI